MEHEQTTDTLLRAFSEKTLVAKTGWRRPAGPCRDSITLRKQIMEIVAILLLTVTMVGIGWAANDRGAVRTAGREEATRRLDA